MVNTPLSAPLNNAFDYTRSVGPTIGAFLTGLRRKQIIGGRGSDGRVYVPPPEYDSATKEPITDFVDVGSSGTVQSWSWVTNPYDGQPLGRPFAYALIRLDGADTSLLHAVDAGTSATMSTGMRVHAVWADERVGDIHDVLFFQPGEGEPSDRAEPSGDPVTMITTPVRLEYMHAASAEESNYLRGLAEGRILGGRTDSSGKVYVPPRGADPTDGRPTAEQVELPDTGIVTTYCIVNVPFLGQKIKPPYIAAYVLLDGADIAFLHLILECDPSEVRMGMRVQAKWKPREEWGFTLENIEYFKPTGEADADYDTYKHHL
ncbi:OB-fold domain-containing protein [Rhodococcus sp. G-MC3]|uniref:Zn-ribbon domain-containing OB-fold protein n=1 Tax=Rhodococcus sp. G-MC3 TaxID=3046209 RepID=UPI0024BA30BA|nr:OB-fold nucleic acid binding domain-containing protein [Rhodococcus sp. G-MC3]MDJ0393350.1 OB-fold domain-containing protein [Rhodococcus sp. G-MC3]